MNRPNFMCLNSPSYFSSQRPSPWNCPALWPQAWTLQAWQQVLGSTSVLGTTLWLGLASAGTALVLAVACLECLPAPWRAALFSAAYLPLALPSLLWFSLLFQHRAEIDAQPQRATLGCSNMS